MFVWRKTTRANSICIPIPEPISSSGGTQSLGLLFPSSLPSSRSPRPGAELLFEVFSQRYERGSVLVTTNLPLGWAYSDDKQNRL